MDYQKIAAVGLILISAAFLITHIQQERTSEASVNATFSTNGSQVSWALLEVAANETERREGLMNRTKLGERRGMLFVFEDEDFRSFWMKNTYIPLDIIFLDANRTIINVEDARPQPNVSEKDLNRYRSDAPAKYVIEVREGFAENFSISEGSEVAW